MQPWLVWQSGNGWIMLKLWVKLKLILGQTMLEGEAIAAFRPSPIHCETTKIVVVNSSKKAAARQNRVNLPLSP